MSLAPELLRILVCPKCKGALEHRLGPPEVLICRSCRLVYEVQDGIPVMLESEARATESAPESPSTSPA